MSKIKKDRTLRLVTEAKAEKKRPGKEKGLVVFAFRLTGEEREAIHKAVLAEAGFNGRVEGRLVPRGIPHGGRLSRNPTKVNRGTDSAILRVVGVQLRDAIGLFLVKESIVETILSNYFTIALP